MDTDITGAGQEVQRVIDARQAWSAMKLIHVEEGCSEVSFSNFPANALSNSNMSINVLVPSDTGVCRDLLYHMSGTITIVGANANSPQALLGTPGAGYVPVGFSESALDQICSVEQITFGGISNQTNRSQCGVELSRLNTSSSVSANYLSGCLEGQMKDVAIDFVPFLNSNRNVLAQCYDKVNSDQVAYPRTLGLQIINQTATTATLYYDVYFTSKVAPFVSNGQQRSALRGLQNLLIQFTFTNQILTNILSVALVNGFTLTSVAFNTPNVFEVWMKFITPSPHALLPLSIFENDYEYSQVQCWSNPSTLINGGQTNKQLNFQQISGSVIPDRILIGARTNYQNRTPTSPVFYYPIADNGVNLRFNNRPILNTADQRQLFEMSRINGLTQCDFPQFIGQNISWDTTAPAPYVLGGSFIVINPSRDCSIVQQGLANGSIANWTLQGSIQINNQTAQMDDSVELFVVAIYGGRVHIESGKAVARLGYFSDGEAEKVMADASHPPISDDLIASFEPAGDAGNSGYYGGGFWSSIGHFFKKAGKYLWKHKGTIAKVASAVAPLVGLGEQGKGYDPRNHPEMSKKTMANRFLRK